jgi:hypothetical protein
MNTSVIASKSPTILGFFMVISSSLDITDPVTESIDDLDVLDVWDSILSIGEVLYIVPKALIVLLFDSLQGLSGRWTLVRALEVPNEHGT